MAMGRETWVQDDLVASWTEMPRSPGTLSTTVCRPC